MHPFVPLADPDSVLSILSQISMFGGVTEEQQDEIFSRLEIGTFKRGETIFCTGDEPRYIYIVKSGLISLFISDAEVKIEKKRLGKGECFGHVALMSVTRHSISAVAVVDSEIIVVSKTLLEKLHHEDSELFSLLILNIARELARRLQFTDHLLLEAVHSHGKSSATPEISGP
jgi:CRP/FNR family transcriptional regulator, cyclic AMP receptor protein